MKINEKQWPALSGSCFNEGNGGREVETKEGGEMDRERKGEKGSLMNVGAWREMANLFKLQFRYPRPVQLNQ